MSSTIDGTATITTGVTLTSGGGSSYSSPLTIDYGASVSGTVGITADYGVTIQTAGSVAGTTDAGILLEHGGSVTNQLSGQINGYTFGIRAGQIPPPPSPYSTLTPTPTIEPVTVYNSNTITGSAQFVAGDGSGPSGGIGIALYSGGTVVNEAGAVVTGSLGGIVLNGSQDDSLANFGAISSDYRAVSMLYGGSLTNAAGASITGGVVGVAGIGATIQNSGLIIGTESDVSVGVYLDNGGSLTNDAGGTITGSKGGVYGDDGLNTIVNSGVIGGDDTQRGVALRSGGAITNLAHGTISGMYGGVQVSGAEGTVGNDGLIASASGSGGYSGLYLEAGGSISNGVDGTITGDGFGVKAVYVAVTIENHGSISGTYAGFSSGVYMGEGGALTNAIGATITGGSSGLLLGSYSAATFAVVNYGTISGGNGSGNGIGISVVDGAGSITNLAAGTIYGDVEGIASFTQAPFTLDNSGVVSGGSISPDGTPSFGVVLSGGGAVINRLGGTISGKHAGVATYQYSASVDNSGTIRGDVGGVLLSASGSVTNEIGGIISGITAADAATILNSETITTGAVYNFDTGSSTGSLSAGSGVALNAGGYVTNLSGASISGDVHGVVVGGTDATVRNAGTIVGGTGDAVYLDASGANRLIIDVGATFTGTVVANATASNVLELTSAANGGALAGLGSDGKYQNFQTVTIDAGASWDIGGTKTGIGQSKLYGFHAGDRLDITDLAFNGTYTATATGNVLTVTDSSGDIKDSIALYGDFSGHAFDLLSDGGPMNGTFIEEDGVACYLRGTRVMTCKGPVAVERLKIGDFLVTPEGLMPLKWVGRRAYSGWLALGNPEIQPIRFKAGSLADKVPCRDLLVSPEHAMFIDGMLIPARHLVNGISIVKAAAMEEIQYFHLELERHAVIFAEDAASESFVDDDSRGMFNNAYEFRKLYRDAPRNADAVYCAPRIEDGYELEAVRRRLAARAARLSPDGAAVDSTQRRRLVADAPIVPEANSTAEKSIIFDKPVSVGSAHAIDG